MAVRTPVRSTGDIAERRRLRRLERIEARRALIAARPVQRLAEAKKPEADERLALLPFHRHDC